MIVKRILIAISFVGLLVITRSNKLHALCSSETCHLANILVEKCQPLGPIRKNNPSRHAYLINGRDNRIKVDCKKCPDDDSDKKAVIVTEYKNHLGVYTIHSTPCLSTSKYFSALADLKGRVDGLKEKSSFYISSPNPKLCEKFQKSKSQIVKLRTDCCDANYPGACQYLADGNTFDHSGSTIED